MPKDLGTIQPGNAPIGIVSRTRPPAGLPPHMDNRNTGFIAAVAFSVVASLGAYFLDWNLLRPYIARQVSDATGRTFAINGDLDVRLTSPPKIIANGIELGNTPWGRQRVFAQAQRIELTLGWRQLLRGQLHIQSIALSAPQVHLEVNEQGESNWQLASGRQGDRHHSVDVDALSIDHGTLTYLDPAQHTDFTATIDTEDLQHAANAIVRVKGTGQINGLPSSVTGRVGALLQLRTTATPYPLDLHATLGATQVTLAGALKAPFRLEGGNVAFTLSGHDLAQLYPLFGIPVAPSPPYKIAGTLDHTGTHWNFSNLHGVVGKSDVRGSFAVDVGQTPKFIRADLVSDKLDIADLGGFIGTRKGTIPATVAPPPGKVLPVEPYSLEKLRSANADIRFRGTKITTRKSLLENMDTHILMEGGTVELAPLRFAVAGGFLNAQVFMDGRQGQLVTHANITAKGLHLSKFMPTQSMRAVSAGTFGGQARLNMHGNSIAQMLGTANGDAALIMDGGTVSELALRLMNLDLANAVILMLGGDRQTPIQCMVSRFTAVNGDFQVQDMALETAKVDVLGNGHVNLSNETLSLRLAAQSKGFSLVSLRGPVDISGTLSTPKVSPEIGSILARGGLAAATGIATSGVGALIPLLDFGKRPPSHCATLVERDSTGKPNVRHPAGH